MPDGHVRLDPYQERDFSAFVHLLNAASHPGTPATSEAAQLEYESWLNRDLSQTRAVIRHPDDPGQLIAYADLFTRTVRAGEREANLSLGVRPTWQDGDLETELLEWLMQRANDLGADTLNIYTPAPARILRNHLELRGFEVVGAYHKLTLEHFPTDLPTTLPAGYTLRSHQAVNNDELFIRIMNRAYSDLWGHSLATPEVWAHIVETYTPENLFLLFSSDEAIGCTGFRLIEGETSSGSLDGPGLVPEYRTAELYSMVAAWGLKNLAKKRAKPVTLETWGEADETISAYQHLGFKIVFTELGYQKRLRA